MAKIIDRLYKVILFITIALSVFCWRTIKAEKREYYYGLKMARLYETKSRLQDDLPDEHIERAITSWTHFYPKGEMVNVVGSDGQIGAYVSDDLPAAINSGEYKILTSRRLHQLNADIEAINNGKDRLALAYLWLPMIVLVVFKTLFIWVFFGYFSMPMSVQRCNKIDIMSIIRGMGVKILHTVYK